MLREKKRLRAAAARRSSIAGDRPPRYGSPNIPPFTVVRGPVPRMPRATVVRDRLIPNGARGDNLLALQVRKDLNVYSTSRP